MKIKLFVLLFLLLLCLLSIFVKSSSASFWEKTFGGSEIDIGNYIQQTRDGGYIIVGKTSSFGVDVTDVYLIKTDANGNEVWSRTFGASRYDEGLCVRQTRDGGYIIAGYIEPSGPGTDVYLIKTDANGDETWSKTFGGTNYDKAYSVQQTNDDGYILVGSTYSFGSDSTDVYLIKTDSNGNEVWSKTFGGTGADVGYSVQLTNDGGYIIVGETSSFAGGQLRIYLIKTDANGNEVWQRAQVFGIGYSVQQTRAGGYIIGGIYPPNNYDALLVKTDAYGYLVWSKTFGGQWHDIVYSLQQTHDQGYILTGFTNSFDSDYTALNDVYLIKTDADGNEVWSNTFGAPDSMEEGQYVIQNRDCEYVIVGSKNGDVYLISYLPPNDIESLCVKGQPWLMLLLD